MSNLMQNRFRALVNRGAAGPLANRRLMWLLALAAMIVLGDLALRAWDTQQKLDAEVRSTRARIATLRQSADGIDWQTRISDLQKDQDKLASQLWHAPSQAQAQAQLRDWLQRLLRDAGIARASIALQPTNSPSGSSSMAIAFGELGQSQDIDPLNSSSLAESTIRVRALVSFDLLPKSLESFLLHVEDSRDLANVDTLNVSRRSRRVELSVSMPVVITQPASDKELPTSTSSAVVASGKASSPTQRRAIQPRSPQ